MGRTRATERRAFKEAGMSKRFLGIVAGAAVALAGLVLAGGAAAGDGAEEWAVNATAIEACSCTMFCPCYFNTQPSAHHEHGGASKHFCRANLVYRINRGHYGATQLDGAKFWIATDLGGDFSHGEMEWAVLTFDKSLTPAQREAIGIFAGHLFPVKWKSFSTAEGVIDRWEYDDETAVATLDGGKSGEVRLRRPAASATAAGPIVIRNLKYWGAPRNDGFVLMPNEVEAYRVGPNAFEFKGTNGFLITVDMTSKDVAPRTGGM
jgi:hypothetical protein